MVDKMATANQREQSKIFRGMEQSMSIELTKEVGFDVLEERKQMLGTNFGLDLIVCFLRPSKRNLLLALGPTPLEPFWHRRKEGKDDDPKADSGDTYGSSQHAVQQRIGNRFIACPPYLQ